MKPNNVPKPFGSYILTQEKRLSTNKAGKEKLPGESCASSHRVMEKGDLGKIRREKV